MPTYTVYFSATFSDSVDVEAESEQEAYDISKRAVEDDWQAYSREAGYTIPFNDVSIDEIQESDY